MAVVMPASLRQPGLASSSGRSAATPAAASACTARKRSRPQRLVCSASAATLRDTIPPPVAQPLSPLASYDLLGRSRWASSPALSDTAWFQAAVNAIVLRVCGTSSSSSSSNDTAAATPFLQLVRRRPGAFGGPQLSSLQLTDKHAWAAAARQLSSVTGPDCMVLVQPVDSAEAACVPGCQRMQDASAAAASSSPHSEYSGRIGDCCDGSSSEHHEHESHASSSSGSSNGSGDTGYWGLVVQCRGAGSSHIAGCYLLKTVRSGRGSSSSSCQCTHWSVMRVCQNAPLQQQLRSSWLTS